PVWTVARTSAAAGGGGTVAAAVPAVRRDRGERPVGGHGPGGAADPAGLPAGAAQAAVSRSALPGDDIDCAGDHSAVRRYRLTPDPGSGAGPDGRRTVADAARQPRGRS